MFRRNNLPIVAAGLIVAAGSVFGLSGHSSSGTTRWIGNPVVQKVVAQSKSHWKQGRWSSAAKLLAPYATPDNPEALLEFSKLLSRGWGIPRDLDKAREKLLLAVQHDFPKRGEAAFELAKVYRGSAGDDCARIAFEWFTKAVQWGFHKAHAELGRHHARGIGVDVDLKAALHHYEIAARNGAANSLLSFIKLVSRRDRPDTTLPAIVDLVSRVIPLLEQEALAGRGSSAKVLGRLYRDGVVVDASKVKARLWAKRGAELGDTGAMCDWALLVLNDQPKLVDIERSLKMLRQASELNNAGATTELGRLHLAEKFGLKRQGAVALFERGIEAAHPGAMLEMARLRQRGDLIEQNVTTALELAERAAALGHSGSKRFLEQLKQARQLDPARSTATVPSVPIKKVQAENLRPIADQSKMNSTQKIKALTGATTITRFGGKG